MGVKSQLAPTGSHRIVLTSAKPSVSREGAASAGPTSTVGAGRSGDELEEEEEVVEEEKEKGEEGEEGEEEEASDAGASALLSSAFPFNARDLQLRRPIALPPAMRALRCMVCHEGYRLRPNELIGAYTFSRRFSDLSTWSLTSTTSRVAVNWSISTVSHFNTIHFSCHDRAKRADSALKLPKREWDGAALRNGGTLCNALFPLRGPQVSPAVYARGLVSWWESVLSLSHVDGSRFLVLLLTRTSLPIPAFPPQQVSSAVYARGLDSCRRGDGRQCVRCHAGNCADVAPAQVAAIAPPVPAAGSA
ncbi:unnamed protein product [Closterium sp. Naga37s-1]|nr:unnamed protein product [Closterium sp. Naga37s-1]